jgi:ornithine cyclodeaminase/alanine dehydrogenase-like protein (mu-crystallin family)
MISGRDVKKLLTVEDVLKAVEETFIGLKNNNVYHPIKDPMWLNDSKTNMLLAMPAFLKDKKLAGVKWVNMFKEQQPGYPTVGGTLLTLNHSENGSPYAIMEATTITTMRTAGGHGAIAAKYLAKKDSRILAIIGCGEEAKAGADALLRLFALEAVQVFDIRREAMEEFKGYVSQRIQTIICKSAQEAVLNADIVMTVTTSRKPVVMFEWLPRGCTVLGLYSLYDFDPTGAKKSDKWVLGSKQTDKHQIIFDPLLKEHRLSMEDVYADLGEIITGCLPARENDQEIILYSCLGMGALDAAVGQIVYERAVEQNIGTVIDLT